MCMEPLLVIIHCQTSHLFCSAVLQVDASFLSLPATFACSVPAYPPCLKAVAVLLCWWNSLLGLGLSHTQQRNACAVHRASVHTSQPAAPVFAWGCPSLWVVEMDQKVGHSHSQIILVGIQIALMPTRMPEHIALAGSGLHCSTGGNSLSGGPQQQQAAAQCRHALQRAAQHQQHSSDMFVKG